METTLQHRSNIGFGKSPVAIAVALTLGASYICTSTKDLQIQYARDFPFVRIAKGKNNFICNVKEDFIRKGTELMPTYHSYASVNLPSLFIIILNIWIDNDINT